MPAASDQMAKTKSLEINSSADECDDDQHRTGNKLPLCVSVSNAC